MAMARQKMVVPSVPSAPFRKTEYARRAAIEWLKPARPR